MLEYVYELVDLINDFDGNLKTENRMRDLICYLSDNNTLEDKELINKIVFEAAEKLRVFGYIKGNNPIGSDEKTLDNLSNIKHIAIQNFYTSKVFFNNILDKRQKDIIECYQNLSSKRLLVSAPTSFGKTFILREIIFLNQNRYNNILLIFPTIALLNENTESMNNLISSLGVAYKIINNVYSGIDPREKHIFILTPERVLKLLSDNSALKIDFFFFDEVYKIDEDFNTDEDCESDGNNYKYKEDTSNRSKAFRIALYLLAKKVEDFYLAGPYLSLHNLKLGLKRFVDENKITIKQIDFEPTMRIEIDAWKKSTIQNHPVLGRKSIEIFNTGNLSTTEKILGINQYIDSNDLGQTIFYCSTPSLSMSYVRKLIEYLPQKNNSDINPDFIEHLRHRYGFKVGNCGNSAQYWSLVYALENGYGIHHGKFPKYVQNEILKMFNDSKYNTLFCTSTIIEGVNTNAQNVVIINNSIGKRTMSAFAIKNIKGRAGRYYHNYIGRVFYTDKKQKEIENENQIQLNFPTFDSKPILNVDLDNADINDLFDSNKVFKNKRDKQFDRELLPDNVYEKNRLYARDVQERYLKHLLSDNVFSKFVKLIGHTGNIKLFLENKMMNKILETAEAAEIISGNKVKIYCAVVNKYSIENTRGVLKYHIEKHIETEEKKGNDPLVTIDRAYINAFDQIRNIVEYEIPKLLCLFEALYACAASKKGYDTSDFNLSAIIRFYELGVTTEFGLSLVEFGFPIDTIKAIERNFSQLSSLSTKEAIAYLRKENNSKKVLSILDSFELSLFRNAIKSFEKQY